MSAIFTPEMITLIVGIIVNLVIAVVPQFEGIKSELVVVVSALVGLVIAGLSGERIAAARASGSTHAERLSASSAAPAPTKPYGVGER